MSASSSSSEYEMEETPGNPRVHEIRASYEYDGQCCQCSCCPIDRDTTLLGQGVLLITSFFGCCGCNGREEHIIKTEQVERVIIKVPKSGECCFISPVRVTIETNNGHKTPLRLHRTDAKAFRADMNQIMDDK